MMISHLSGFDHSGHAHNALHPEFQRKLLDTEVIIEEIIEKMDDETTLVVFGDHGMTLDGSHGGSSEEELRSVLFAYQKKPFPMSRKYQTYHEEF